MKQTTRTPSLSRLLAAVFILATFTLILTGARAAASGPATQSGAASEAQKYLSSESGRDSLMAAVRAAGVGDGARIMQSQQARLLADDGLGGDKFGYSVAISGNTAVVGAYLRGPGASLSRLGAAYIFQRTNSIWNRQVTLLPSDLLGTVNFGYSVAISGDTIVVGALGNNQVFGQVYIFQRNGTAWSERQRIQSASRTFGTSVALDGTILLVGEPGAITRSQTGAVNAYRFNGSTWDFEAQFVGNAATTADAFGISVSISGNTALVGAYGDDTNIGVDAGSAYIFVRNGTIWTEQAQFFATDPGVGNLYGWSVSLSGNTAAVGAYNDDLPGKANAGAVYVYERTGTTWSAQPKLVAGDAKADDKLGYSVAINGNIIVAGAYFYDSPTTQNVGAAYIFQRVGTVWGSGGIATPEEPQPGDLFGSSVALSDTTFLAGAPNADLIPTNLNIGTSHVYSLRPSTRILANFDGDALTDLSVFRPSNSSWYARQSSNGLSFIQQFGASGDLLAPGDYDGDGRTDLAVFRPSNGTWYILHSSNGVFRARQFGTSGDLPVPGDYDGNGITDIALFRPSDNTWYIFVGSISSFLVQQFGASGDRPVQSDYDGDGKTDIAVFRPANGTWYMIQSLTNSFRAQPWGASGDVAAPGDYDGDTRTDIAVFRPAEGKWYILQSTHNTSRVQTWGTIGDVAVPADYNGDGKADIAVFRPADGNWYILESGLNALRVEQWGASGDVPVPTAHLP
ncbi:MAG: VCBS repeat-containing protein [Pyrinomonadaceae bacterium]|nr:VCBS repeat-containing protein [Pyrinomonadaceae bacterium]